MEKSTCTIWCPFDTEESEYVKIFKTKYSVIYSILIMAKIFLTYAPKKKIMI